MRPGESPAESPRPSPHSLPSVAQDEHQGAPTHQSPRWGPRALPPQYPKRSSGSQVRNLRGYSPSSRPELTKRHFKDKMNFKKCLQGGQLHFLRIPRGDSAVLGKPLALRDSFSSNPCQIKSVLSGCPRHHLLLTEVKLQITQSVARLTAASSA